MSALDKLAACAGTWSGTNSLSDPSMNVSDDSPSTIVVAPVLGGRFIRMDYTWSYKGDPQEGSLLIGCVSDAGEVTAQWIDSWHMGESVMSCHGMAGADGSLSVTGSYAAPPGPDWGWRIAVEPVDDSDLRLFMYNITPDVEEGLAVHADYRRD